MAILVEEEKKTSNASALFGGVVVFVVIAAAVYYIFLVQPPAVSVTPPPNFAVIAQIAQISFDPTSVLNSQNFQSLKQYIPEPSSTGPIPVGKTNPFVP